MNIHLVSKDPELSRLCRDILADLPGRSALSVAGPEDLPPAADLCIWDFEPEFPVPAALNQSLSTHLFLVDRKHLAAFQQAAPQGNILLKPATRATLAAFLEIAMRRAGSGVVDTLIQTNLRLQEYDHNRTDFLARAVHDFHAPLTALSGYCGLLLDGPLGSLEDNQREVLQRMQNSIQRLSRMASAMSLLSAGLQVKKRPNLQRDDLSQRLNQSLHEIAPFADEKRISITPNLQPCDDLYFEPDQIEQVLVNLLDNACRFTPRSGSIEIRGYLYFWDRRSADSSAPPAVERRGHTSHEPNSYRIDIRDSGAAIPEDHLHRIFEEYISFGGGRSGGGLGLAICRMIVSQHEGKIWAENTELGPMFSFVLPIYRLAMPAMVNGNGVNQNLQWAEIGAH